jgi:hypothetical protein
MSKIFAFWVIEFRENLFGDSLSICVFRKNEHRKGSIFPMGVDETSFVYAPRKLTRFLKDTPS